MVWGAPLLVLHGPRVFTLVYQGHVPPEVVPSVCGVVTAPASEYVRSINVVLLSQVCIQLPHRAKLLFTPPTLIPICTISHGQSLPANGNIENGEG